MDPNANLAEQLRLMAVTGLFGPTEAQPRALTKEERARLRELVGALRDWIGAGGFLPTAWLDGNNVKGHGVGEQIEHNRRLRLVLR